MTKENTATEIASFIHTQELLDHWQGHRRLTRRMIEAYPEDKLFSYSVGGMRPFGELITELLNMGVPGIRGVVTGKWSSVEEMSHHAKKDLRVTKEELLEQWDKDTEELHRLWPQIPAERFAETDTIFGRWEGTIYSFILYWIDNEIHHRGQGYVYLRTLGIEPPHFWER